MPRRHAARGRARRLKSVGMAAPPTEDRPVRGARTSGRRRARATPGDRLWLTRLFCQGKPPRRLRPVPRRHHPCGPEGGVRGQAREIRADPLRLALPPAGPKSGLCPWPWERIAFHNWSTSLSRRHPARPGGSGAESGPEPRTALRTRNTAPRLCTQTWAILLVLPGATTPRVPYTSTEDAARGYTRAGLRVAPPDPRVLGEREARTATQTRLQLVLSYTIAHIL